jgi:hypothetical protein
VGIIFTVIKAGSIHEDCYGVGTVAYARGVESLGWGRGEPLQVSENVEAFSKVLFTGDGWAKQYPTSMSTLKVILCFVMSS